VIVTSASAVVSSEFRLIPLAPATMRSIPLEPRIRSVGVPVDTLTVISISEPSASGVRPGASGPPVRSITISAGTPVVVIAMVSVLATVAPPQAAPLSVMSLPDRPIVAVSPPPTSTVTVGGTNRHVAAVAGSAKSSIASTNTVVRTANRTLGGICDTIPVTPSRTW
jgi:hypothetical protein